MRYPVTLVTWAVMVLKRLLPGRVMDKILQGELKRALKPHVKENIDNRERLHVRRKYCQH